MMFNKEGGGDGSVCYSMRTPCLHALHVSLQQKISKIEQCHLLKQSIGQNFIFLLFSFKNQNISNPYKIILFLSHSFHSHISHFHDFHIIFTFFTILHIFHLSNIHLSR